MSSKRDVVGWLLVALVLVIVGGATYGTPDLSWSSSFFDDDDLDYVFLLLTDHGAALPVPLVALLPFIAALAAVILLKPSAYSLLTPAASRLRAPPLV